MRAGKAYISSLGTTGVLIASSLLMLTMVGALVGFDRWPSQAAAEPDTVAIAPDGSHPVRVRSGYLFVAPRAVRLAGAASGAGVAPPAGAAAAVALETGAATASIPASGPGVAMQQALVPPRAPVPDAPGPGQAAAGVPARPAPDAPDPRAGMPSADGLTQVLPAGGTAPGDGGRLQEATGGVEDATGQVTPPLAHLAGQAALR